jgi:hypothetical protein
MNPLYRAARDFIDFARSQGWRCILIGGLAVGRWGRPRATIDVDFSLWLEFGSERVCVREILKHFHPRIAGAEEFALANRILLLWGPQDVPIDVAFASFPFEAAIFDRATEFRFTRGVKIPTASSEDLVFLKASANRAQDWIDIEGIVITQGASLDWAIVEAQLESIQEIIDFGPILKRLQDLRDRTQPG